MKLDVASDCSPLLILAWQEEPVRGSKSRRILTLSTGGESVRCERVKLKVSLTVVSSMTIILVNTSCFFWGGLYHRESNMVSVIIVFHLYWYLISRR